MDRLLVADVKEVDMTFNRNLKCSTSFHLTNLMHTMPVAISLISSNPTTFSFSQPFSLIPPLSTSTFAILRIAVGNGKGDFSMVLIEAGGDVNWRGSGEESLVSLGVKSESVEILLDLIASGAEFDESIDLVLHEAARMNNVELMEVLVQGFPKLDPNLVDSNGQNTLHVSASLADVEGMKFLISVGGNGDVADINGYTALHFAAVKGSKEVVELGEKLGLAVYTQTNR